MTFFYSDQLEHINYDVPITSMKIIPNKAFNEDPVLSLSSLDPNLVRFRTFWKERLDFSCEISGQTLAENFIHLLVYPLAWPSDGSEINSMKRGSPTKLVLK